MHTEAGQLKLAVVRGGTAAAGFAKRLAVPRRLCQAARRTARDMAEAGDASAGRQGEATVNTEGVCLALSTVMCGSASYRKNFGGCPAPLVRPWVRAAAKAAVSSAVACCVWA